VLCRQCNIPVSWLLLQEEGLIISKSLGDDSMNISSLNGWLSKWKKRYSIREMKVAPEEGAIIFPVAGRGWHQNSSKEFFSRSTN